MTSPIRIAILGYQDFIIKAQKYINAIEGVDISVYQSYGSEALPLAQTLQREGFDAIIAGRINCKYIAGMVDIPVIEIRATMTDFIDSFTRAKEYNCDTVGLSLPDFSIYDIDFDILGTLTGMKIKKVSHDNPLKLESSLKSLKESGVSVVIGNLMTMAVCEKLGITGIFVYSMEHVMLSCIDKAIDIVTMRRQEKKNGTLISQALDLANEGIIQIDASGKIQLFNQTARSLFRIRSESVIDADIDMILPELKLTEFLSRTEAQLNHAETIRHRRVVISRIPILSHGLTVGAAAVMQSREEIEQLEYCLLKAPRSGFTAKYSFDDLIGTNPSFVTMVASAKRFSTTNLPVLIEGETGTGKELLAHSIHNSSPRSNGPFVAINCAALSPNLLESELFGYEPGAFTGASRSGKTGLFELANQGTLFLDEINSIPPDVQVKLLRAIEAKEIIRVGGNHIIPINVRVISSSNVDILSLIEEKQFRSDLFYRIGTLRLHIPPLRERTEDIPLLIDILSRSIPSSTPSGIEYLKKSLGKRLSGYLFPGNVRELKCFLERFFLLAEGRDLTESEAASLVDYSIGNYSSSYTSSSIVPAEQTDGERIEKEEIVKILENCHYNRSEAAQRLGISRSTLYRRLQKLGL